MYDYIFITHLPSFYKVNLYNEIAKIKKIFVIFISSGSSIRAADFSSANFNFDFEIINDGFFESRKILASSVSVMKVLSRVKAGKIVVNGWDLPEFWLAVFFNKSGKKCLALESSIFDSNTTGFRQLIKKFFLKKIDCVYASGEPHARLLKKLGYSGQYVLTNGVGQINLCSKQNKRSSRDFSGEFLYVGRLSAEKNIEFLFDYFRKNKNFTLNIVGSGPLLEELQRKAPGNVNFLGYVNNSDLGDIYTKNDIFILPSAAETWGLVVEEALFFGLPVLCSNRVGCSEDLVLKFECGLTFNLDEENDLSHVAARMIENYSFFYNTVADFDGEKWIRSQISVYLE